MTTRRPVRSRSRSTRRDGTVSVIRLSADFTTAFAISPKNAEELTTKVLTSAKPPKDRLRESAELVHAISASGNAQQRRTLIAGFRKSDSELALIHHVATLPREQTAAFIKDYLEDGGSLEAVMQWVSVAGSVMRGTHKPRPRMRTTARRGWFNDAIDAVGDAISDAGEAIVDSVDSVVDAVVGAGKTIAEAIGTAADWTMDQVTDLVEALIRAGKTVAQILAAAATKGAAQLKKYVEAVLAAGRELAEVIAWAASQAAANVKTVVEKLLALGRSILAILEAALAQNAPAVLAIVRALLANGRTLANILSAMAGQALAAVRAVVSALLTAGQTLRNILVEAAKLAAAACRRVVNALLDLGRTLRDIVRFAVAAAGTTIRAILQALLDLGRTLTQILVAAAQHVASTARAVVQTLLAMGRTVAQIVTGVVGQVKATVERVFRALVALGKQVPEILAALAGRAVSALRTALDALLAMGITLVTLVRDVCLAVPEAFRRGFFEGLVALGMVPLQILKAAAESGVSIVLLAFAVLLEMFGGYRELNRRERFEAERMFGSAIDLDRVKLGFADIPGDILRYCNIELPRAFTTMYLLNFGPGAVVDMQTIIHELAHVWQGVQTGPLYMTRALEAQLAAGLEGLFHKGKYDDAKAYEVTDDALKEHNGDFAKFNPEQQASILEFYWQRKFSGAEVDDSVPSIAQLLPYVQDVNPALTARGARIPIKKTPAATTATPTRRRARLMPVEV
jgi:hypothetical protein